MLLELLSRDCLNPNLKKKKKKHSYKFAFQSKNRTIRLSDVTKTYRKKYEYCYNETGKLFMFMSLSHIGVMYKPVWPVLAAEAAGTVEL